MSDWSAPCPRFATAARRRALRYVAGEALDDALAVAWTLHARGLRAAIDFFGVQVRDAAEVERAVDGYLELARRLSEAPPTASVALVLARGVTPRLYVPYGLPLLDATSGGVAGRRLSHHPN